MKTEHRSKKIMAILLAFMMIVQLAGGILPMTAFADNGDAMLVCADPTHHEHNDGCYEQVDAGAGVFLAPSDRVSIEVDAYDHEPGASDTWVANVSKTVTIAFTDIEISTGHSAVISIYRGMSLENYPGKTGGLSDPSMSPGLRSVLTGVSYTAPTAEAPVGKLIYTLTDDCESVNIQLTMSADMNLYYGPITLTPGFAASRYTGADCEATAAAEVRFSGDPEFSFRTSGAKPTLREIPITSVNSFPFLKGIGSNYLFVNKLTYVITYPAQATLAGIVYGTDSNNALVANGSVPDGDILYNDLPGVVHDEANHTVSFYYEDVDGISNVQPRLTLIFPAETPNGSYRTKNKYTFVPWDDSAPITISTTEYVTIFQISTESTQNRLNFSGTTYGSYPSDMEGNGFVARLTVFMPAGVAKVTKQIVRYDFPAELHVRMFDLPHQAQSDVEITYKVYGDDTPRKYTIPNCAAGNIKINAGANALNLAPGEYLEWTEAKVGDFTYEYASEDASGKNYLYVFGNILPGDEKGTLYHTICTVTSEDDDPLDPEDPATARVPTRVDDPAHPFKLAITRKDPDPSLTALAGETVRLNAGFSSYGNYVGTTQRIENPVYYLALPKGFVLDGASVAMTQSGNSALAFTIDAPRSLPDGTNIYAVRTQNCLVGDYNDLRGTLGKILNMTFSVKLPNVPGQTIFDLNDIIMVGGDVEGFGGGMVPFGFSAASGAFYATDTRDINNNRLTNDTFCVSNSKFTVRPQSMFDVFAEISVSGENNFFTYDSVDAMNTTVAFTPGKTADYRVTISNYTAGAGNLTAYIPVPKTGMNYGQNFQSAPFTWDMNLSGTVTGETAGYTFSYAKIPSGQEAAYGSASYVTDTDAWTADDWAEVSMIKVVCASVASETSSRFLFNYAIGETDETAISKVNDRNIFNPYFYTNAGGNASWRPGKSVAGLLQTGTISGTVFVDTDRNGIMDGESGKSGVTVTMERTDGSEPYTDSTTTGQDGKYRFGELPAGTYKVTFTRPAGYKFSFPTTGITENIVAGTAEALNVNAGIYLETPSTTYYSVAYHAGAEGTGSVPSQTNIAGGTPVTLASGGFTRAGHTQTGWATGDGGVMVFDLGETVTLNDNLDLYPVWTAVASTDASITVRFIDIDADDVVWTVEKLELAVNTEYSFVIGNINASFANGGFDLRIRNGWLPVNGQTLARTLTLTDDVVIDINIVRTVYTFSKTPDSNPGTALRLQDEVDYTFRGFGNATGVTLRAYTVTDYIADALTFVKAEIPALEKGGGITYSVVFVTDMGRRVVYRSGLSAADAQTITGTPALESGERRFARMMVVFDATVPAGFAVGDEMAFTFRVTMDPATATTRELTNRAGLGFNYPDDDDDDGGNDDNGVEIIDPGTPLDPGARDGESDKDEQTTGIDDDGTPKTGDDSATAGWVAILILSAGALIALTLERQKNKKKFSAI